VTRGQSGDRKGRNAAAAAVAFLAVLPAFWSAKTIHDFVGWPGVLAHLPILPALACVLAVTGPLWGYHSPAMWQQLAAIPPTWLALFLLLKKWLHRK